MKLSTLLDRLFAVSVFLALGWAFEYSLSTYEAWRDRLLATELQNWRYNQTHCVSGAESSYSPQSAADLRKWSRSIDASGADSPAIYVVFSQNSCPQLASLSQDESSLPGTIATEVVIRRPIRFARCIKGKTLDYFPQPHTYGWFGLSDTILRMLPDYIHHWALVVGEGSGAKYIELRAQLPHERDLPRKDIYTSKLLDWKDREVPDFWILNDGGVVGHTYFSDDEIQDAGTVRGH